ncbi:MAG: hypothetical protein LBI28_14895 [Treponema sp.]|jgi:hypothetical protein|nr:hypothetical protein [Treponema sp.]
MTDPGLLQALDYILNHSDEATIDALSEAVDRRRRDLTVFGALGNIPDPQKMSKEISEKLNAGIGGGIESMKKSVRDMMVKILKEHAPELNKKQIDELCDSWLPKNSETKKGAAGSGLPPDVLLSMIEQFVAFSHGEMRESTDQGLREEMGAWPERYWNSFPPVIRQIITDYLKSKISDKDFKSQIVIALKI